MTGSRSRTASSETRFRRGAPATRRVGSASSLPRVTYVSPATWMPSGARRCACDGPPLRSAAYSRGRVPGSRKVWLRPSTDDDGVQHVATGTCNTVHVATRCTMAGGTVEIKLNYARTPSTDGENGMRSSINGSTPPLALAAASKSSMSSASSSRLATCAPHATCTMQHATYNMQPATYNVRYATCAMQDTACTAARVRPHRRAHACTRTGGMGGPGGGHVECCMAQFACCMLYVAP